MAPGKNPRIRPERMKGRAARYMKLSRRYQILAAYVLGDKAEAIAAQHGVTIRFVCYLAAQEGVSKPQGRPRKQEAQA